jgi:flagellar hook-associated protein 2
MIDQLIAVDHRRVDLVEERKTEYESKLSAWQSFNTSLLALKTAAEGLKTPEDFYLYSTSLSTNSSTVGAEDLLSVSTDTTAGPGAYTIMVTNLALAQKLSSNPFSSQTAELGSSYAGDIVVNGKVAAVSATDSLADVAATINGLNTGTDPSGVTATVVNYGTNDYRLILTSDSTGQDGISLLNGSSTYLVQKFGWKDKNETTDSLKNAITNGAQSDRFTAHNVAVKSLLGLSAGESSTTNLTIDGTDISINLTNHSLTDIKDAINTAMTEDEKDITASVVSETVDGTTYYRLQIEGTVDGIDDFNDENNILNTLGILDYASALVSGEVSANSMTSDGSYITGDTLLVDIDGYITYNAGDKINLGGLKTDGVTGVDFDFSISTSTTVQDLLSAIETQYAPSSGDVIAYVTSEGKIRVDDVAGGGGLSVILTDTITQGELEFVDGNGAFGNGAARQRQIVGGEDARVVVDGVEVTNASNIIDNVIAGVTLNLVKEDSETTVTLNVSRDISAVKSNIEDLVEKYNEVMSYINTQFTYDEEEQTTGGILFGDGTLSSVKSDLTSLLTQSVWGVDNDFSILGFVGVNLDNDLILSVDDDELTGYLQTNFNDVMSLFVGQGTTSTSTLTYVSHTRDTQAGEYTVHINRAATRATETGSVDLLSGGAGEALTITQGSSTAAVTITADMTLGDIVNEINEELDTEYTQALVGDVQLYSNALNTIAITSETKWNSIYDGGGQLGFTNLDTISFSGTSRGGDQIAGSYQITNTATESVQGLLSAVEDAFSSGVTAAVDSSGRIVITDKYGGTSQLSIGSISHPSESEFFGTVDVTAAAGDGSHQGRYAMNITAADDGSDHLVLRADDYGSTSFSISQNSVDGIYHHIVHTATGNTTDASNGTVYVSGQAGGSSGTAWDDIYGASVSNGETITISGSDHGGGAVGPTNYTIDTANDTVDDLLTTIRTVFGGDSLVDVFFKDGQIHLEDKTQGSSSMALNLTYNGTGTLTLGDFDQSTQRDMDLGLINGDVAGQDVAGTINGETATGAGQTLSGDEDNVNTDGLSVRYTGTSDALDAGDVKMTLGIAELFDRVLFNITDSVEGYVSFKQDSLQDSIDRFETDIEGMEARLDLKMEMMINRFVAMELALSKIQNQSDWLTGQVSALFSGWV